MRTKTVSYSMQRATARAQCAAAITQIENVEIETKLKSLTSTAQGRARLGNFLRDVE